MTDEELAAVEAAEAEMLRAAIRTVTAMAQTGADPDSPRNYVAITLAGMRAPFDRAEVHLIRPGGLTPHEARVEADEEVRRLRAEAARLAAVATEACDVAALRAAIPTPDRAAVVAAVNAYGEAARLHGVTAGNGAWDRLCADKEKADAARAALLALIGCGA